MNLSKYLPMTETTYYILMALCEPGHGYAVMQKVEEMSEGHVRIAAGTMYGALENLGKQKLIAPVASKDARRKMFQTTSEGHTVLQMEAQRLEHLISVYKKFEENKK